MIAVIGLELSMMSEVAQVPYPWRQGPRSPPQPALLVVDLAVLCCQGALGSG
jgi:hypothetical protein